MKHLWHRADLEEMAGTRQKENKSGALELEAQGWRVWLKTCFPFAFDDEFSPDHEKYWELRWSVILRIREQQKCLALNLSIPEQYEISEDEWTALLILGRGLGKSATIEAAAVMRGAILNGGYCLYISEAQDQADEHLGNCKILIDHEESRLTEFYPKMAIDDNAVVDGMKVKDAADMFITSCGWICRAKGLNSKLRGLRKGGRRPDDIKIDDIDGVNDSIAVSLKKIKQLTSSVIPTQARRFTTIDFGQNLIAEMSVMNQMLIGKSDALSARTVIGVTNTFKHFVESEDYETYFGDDGKIRHRILPTAEPTWSGVDIAQAQKFLNDSGLSTFLAEYQNEFDRERSGKVIPEYNEEIQVITWSMFEEVYGVRQIPNHWKSKAGLDVGYSEGQYPHYSAWVFVATSALNSTLPNKIFLYRGRSFSGTSIDDQAIAIKNELYHNEQISSWQMSHERTGEMLTLRQKYNLPFAKFQYYKAEDGVAQWRHLSKPDKTQPHPFKPDEKDAQGAYILGSPTLFYIVDDDQLYQPRNDKGLRLFREQVAAWEYVAVKLTEAGQTQQKPSKVNDDFPDAFKSTIALFGARATDLTKAERREQALPEHLRQTTIAEVAAVNQDQAERLVQSRIIEMQKMDKRDNEQRRQVAKYRPSVPKMRLR